MFTGSADVAYPETDPRPHTPTRYQSSTFCIALNIILTLGVIAAIAFHWASHRSPTPSTSSLTVAAGYSEIVAEAKKITELAESEAFAALPPAVRAICRQLSDAGSVSASMVKTASVILEDEYSPLLEELKYLLGSSV